MNHIIRDGLMAIEHAAIVLERCVILFICGFIHIHFIKIILVLHGWFR